MKKQSVRIFLFLSLSLLSVGSGFAQLLTNNNQNPTQLVQSVLLGNGVTAFNITYNGDPAAIGFFDGVNTNIGLDSGIIMTTGSIFAPNGPQGPNNTGSGGVDNLYAGDQDLTNICGQPTFNASILEFDFIPQSDTVKFRYVFGSEEYPEYVNSINDAFAFILTGVSTPLPATNIALIPGTNNPVTINTVNNGNTNTGPCTNCAFYVDNETVPGQTIQYDGFTTALTAIHHVICGETYHIKIAIADASDGVWDSGVFLEANSFTSSGVSISSTVDLGFLGNDSTLFEGCGQATLTFTLSGNIANGDTIHFIIAGNATNGVDYGWLPDSIVFDPGQGSAQLVINALQDNIIEGLDTIRLITMPSGPCANTPTEFIIYISDMPVLTAVVGPVDTLVCPGQSTTIGTNVSGGIPGYTYLWNQGLGTNPTQTVSPNVTTTYIVQVSDTCGLQIAIDSVQIVVIPYLPPQAVASADVQLVCPGQSTLLSATTMSGSPTFHYSWNNNEGNYDTATVAPSVTTTYVVTVTDSCGSTSKDSVVVTVIPYVPMSLVISNDTMVCPGEPVPLKVIASGGVPKMKGGNPYYLYNWGMDSTNSSTVVYPTSGSYVWVIVTDSCGNSVRDSVAVGIITPTANFNLEYISDFEIQFTDSSFTDIVKWDWDFDDGSRSTEKNPKHLFEDMKIHDIKLVVTSNLGCSDSIVKTIIPPMFIYLPNAFTPNGDGLNDFFFGKGIGITEYELLIFDRWGELIFTSTDPDYQWNGKWQNNPCEQGVYVYKIKAKGYKNKFEKVGTVTLIR